MLCESHRVSNAVGPIWTNLLETAQSDPSRDASRGYCPTLRPVNRLNPNPKMLHACYKNAAPNPLVANAGLIHSGRRSGRAFGRFSVGAPKASCQLQIIGRQRRKTAGTSRVVARLARRERAGLTRKSTDSLVTERSDSHELMRTRSGTGNAVHRLDSDCFGRRRKR